MSTRRTYTYKDNPELCKKLQDGDNNAAELICCVNMSLARKCADNAARIYGQDWRNDFLQLQQRIKETFFMNKKISEKLLDVIEERVRAQVMYQNLKGLRMEDIHVCL